MLVDVFDYLKLSMGIFIFSLLVVLILILMKKSVVNVFSVSILAFVSCVVSGINMIISGYIADEVPSGGDPITFYLFLIVLILSIVNMVVVSKKKKGEVGKQDIIKI
jgi:hypothetical protein